MGLQFVLPLLVSGQYLLIFIDTESLWTLLTFHVMQTGSLGGSTPLHHCPSVGAAHAPMLRPPHQFYHQTNQFPTSAHHSHPALHPQSTNCSRSHCQSMTSRIFNTNDGLNGRPNSVECSSGLIDLSCSTGYQSTARYHQLAQGRSHAVATPVSYALTQSEALVNNNLHHMMTSPSAAHSTARQLALNDNLQVIRAICYQSYWYRILIYV
jgi:hypothetical protein